MAQAVETGVRTDTAAVLAAAAGVVKLLQAAQEFQVKAIVAETVTKTPTAAVVVVKALAEVLVVILVLVMAAAVELGL